MAKQLIVSGNRILAYGEDCFTTMGEMVKCSNTGNEYPNATVVTCEEFPADIGKVGYEYHAGQFVPCAPFGEGMGNIAVICDACNTMKNSGIPLTDIVTNLVNNAHVYETSYKGDGNSGSSSSNRTKLSKPLPFIPKALLVTSKDTKHFGIILHEYGISFDITNNKMYSITADLSTESPTWYSTDRFGQLNVNNYTYRVIAIG